MIRLQDIDNRFRTFAESHPMLRAFSTGQMHDFNTGKEDEYPRMHVIYEGSRIDEYTKTYSFDVYFLSMPDSEHDEQRQMYIVSSMEAIAEDMLADIYKGKNVFAPDTENRPNQVNTGSDYGFNIRGGNMQPVVESTANVLCGVKLTIGIEVAFRNDVSSNILS
jgi:hypothetical protein